MDILSKLYSYKSVRILFKLTVCLAVVKVGGDLFYYAFSGVVPTFPRYSIQQGGQNPLNPPVMIPYPVEKQIKHKFQQMQYAKYNQMILQTAFNREFFLQKLYKNSPQREDPNQIDHFLHYCQASRMLDLLYIRALRKMSNSGANVTDGINKKIRQLSQFQFNCVNGQKILPQL